MDGGSETMPLNVLRPRNAPAIAAARMPIRIAPGTRRVSSAAIRMNPSTANTTAGDLKSPSVTSVAGCALTMPALCRPMMARNRPMPAAIDSFRLLGMELITHSRMGVRLTIKNRMPDRNTAPSAVSQAWPMPLTTP